MGRLKDPDRQRRHGFNEYERYIVRKHFQHNPLIKQKELATWATDRLRRSISQGMISTTLSDKYAYIDAMKWGPKDRKYERSCKPEWPVLDAALFEWHMRLQATKVPVTGEMLKTAAKELWAKLPEYAGQTTPSFCRRFIESYKARHRIRLYKQHGEAASADITVEAESAMENLRKEAEQYLTQDCYNMDETGLFWNTIPDKTLATCPQSGKKKSKARITACLCSNADGTHKLPPWFIGKYKSPRAFGGQDNRLIQGLNCVYKNNKKAWMTGELMIEYLKWFDQQVAGRRVLLIMDNFSAHESAVRLLEENNQLRNTT